MALRAIGRCVRVGAKCVAYPAVATCPQRSCGGNSWVAIVWAKRPSPKGNKLLGGLKSARSFLWQCWPTP
eukprot:3714210-Pyramimonas_sp.AAC.1